MRLTRFAALACFAVAITANVLRAEAGKEDSKAAADTGKGKTVRLLTVGNSFSGNSTHYLGNLAKAAGNVFIMHPANIGGGTMAQHWEKVEQYEHDPNDPRGLYNTKVSLKQELGAEPWDFVTIQQASIVSHDVATYRPYAKELFDYIHRYAPKAEVLLHETWPYRRDDVRFYADFRRAGEPATQEAMYEGLSKAYETIAAELGVRRIPVGDAFQMANTDPQWGYKKDMVFDFKNAQPPALPDQTHSLNMGWQWAKQKDGTMKLTMDGHHANAAGEYLGACVFYEVLFGESVVGNAFVPPTVDGEYAKFLRETAHAAVEKARGREGK